MEGADSGKATHVSSPECRRSDSCENGAAARAFITPQAEGVLELAAEISPSIMFAELCKVG